MNQCEYTQLNQLDILYVQSGVRLVGVWYNLPGEGAPKGLKSCVNVRFMKTGKLTLLSGNNLVQGKWEG